jgi:guanosine-3',5'-bis(diphosphate) 3'-pyrophosphohydrolase
LWQAAASFAARKHKHQFRKDGSTPYFSHPVRVCLTLAHVFGVSDEVAICAALLHDTIEDTTTDYEDIAERFGHEVARCVSALTKNMALPETEREREYDARLASADWRAKAVKLADTFDNYCDIATYPPEQRTEKRRDARDKCVRAIALVGVGESDPALVRAAGLVRALIKA